MLTKARVRLLLVRKLFASDARIVRCCWFVIIYLLFARILSVSAACEWLERPQNKGARIPCPFPVRSLSVPCPFPVRSLSVPRSDRDLPAWPPLSPRSALAPCSIPITVRSIPITLRRLDPISRQSELDAFANYRPLWIDLVGNRDRPYRSLKAGEQPPGALPRADVSRCEVRHCCAPRHPALQLSLPFDFNLNFGFRF